MTIQEINDLDSSFESFEFLKIKSELFWENEFDLEIRNFIPYNTKWNEGLSVNELIDFQNQMNVEFPESLKNYFLVMNGINFPSKNSIKEYHNHYFYQYPIDIGLIKSNSISIFSHFSVNKMNTPFIFSYYGNRYLIFNEQQIVLSIMNDVVYWSDNLCKAIAQDIFARKIDFRKLKLKKVDNTDFWTNEILV